MVEIISGESLDHYAKQHIFQPLNLQSTTFLPPSGWQDRIAPTQVFNNELRWGKVHDPGTYSLGGVAGVAGVFSDARDLGKFLQCILNNGRLPDNNNNQENKYLLGPLTILKMTTPQTPSSLLGYTRIRLGFRIKLFESRDIASCWFFWTYRLYGYLGLGRSHHSNVDHYTHQSNSSAATRRESVNYG